MSVSYPALASQIATALGHPGNVTSQVTALARGILEELTQNGTATTGPASGNTISGMTGSSMAGKIAGYAPYSGVSTQLNNFCTGIVNHIHAAANVSYTGPSEPPFSTGGTISGLSGSAMAASVQTQVGYASVTSQLLALCTAVATHIMSNAQVNGGTIT